MKGMFVPALERKSIKERKPGYCRTFSLLLSIDIFLEFLEFFFSITLINNLYII